MANLSNVSLQVSLYKNRKDIALPESLVDIIMKNSYDDSYRHEDGTFSIYGRNTYDNHLHQIGWIGETLKWLRANACEGIRFDYIEYEEGCEFVCTGRAIYTVTPDNIDMNHRNKVWTSDEYARAFCGKEFPDFDDFEELDNAEDEYQAEVDSVWEEIGNYLYDNMFGADKNKLIDMPNLETLSFDV